MALTLLQSYRDLESEIILSRHWFKSQTSCSAAQELNHYTTDPHKVWYLDSQHTGTVSDNFVPLRRLMVSTPLHMSVFHNLCNLLLENASPNWLETWYTDSHLYVDDSYCSAGHWVKSMPISTLLPRGTWSFLNTLFYYRLMAHELVVSLNCDFTHMICVYALGRLNCTKFTLQSFLRCLQSSQEPRWFMWNNQMRQWPWQPAGCGPGDRSSPWG